MSGIARKLLVSFTLLVLVFGAAAWAALRGLTEVHDALHGVKHQEAAVVRVLSLASAVRDQYAHMAHTIILGNRSHLPLYDRAHRRVEALLDEVERQVEGAEERAAVGDMRRLSAQLDGLFRARLLPAVVAGERETVAAVHGEVLAGVYAIQERADALAARAEQAIGSYEQHAGMVEHTSHRLTLALFVLATLLAIGVGVYIGRSVARPVARLEEGARRLAAGDLGTRIDLRTPDEFGRLAAQFNRMTAALAENQDRLVQSERLAGIGRLAAGVAHEINNPLGVILGYVRLLLRRATGPLGDDLRIIEEETLRARDIVEGLLDLSRPLQGGTEPVDLRALADEVVARLGEADASGPRVEVHGGAQVEGHPQRLRQVLTNLVKNAREAAGPAGHVEVRVEADERGARVQVEDSGPGLSADAQARLFEPFFTTKPRGTGLGLAVSRAIAQAHGGELSASSRPAGGAAFTLRLPAAARVGARAGEA